VVQTNDTFEASNGFEVGIASGGIRGVVPVSRTLEDGTVFHIGSVEAGIGMNALLLQLQREMELEFALLVDTEFLRATLVEDAFENFVATTPSFDRFSLMNSTLNEDAEQVVALLGDDLFERDDWEPLQELEMGTFAMARIPLRSFIGQRDPSRADAGSIVAWVPLNDAVVTFKRDVAEAIVIALFIVFFLEAMLFFALGQEQKLAMQRKESVTDALTGVSNRRHFDEVLDAEIRRGARGGHPITVILADVDYFKRYNDHYGHQMGDDCLAKVAEAMSSELRRAGDFIARYGGEEFAVVLPDASMTAGLAVAEKLRRAVESLRIPHEKHPGGQKVTVSMGVASGRVSQNDAKAIVAMADEALYRAKGAGRNNSQGLRFGDEGEAGQPLPLLYR
jgi:diguanylate cyclase (GGDEF)-like protein